MQWLGRKVNNMERTRTLPMLLILLLPGCSLGMTSTNELRAARALFGQFETVFYTRADLLSGFEGYKSLSKEDANYLRAPFAELLARLEALGSAASREIVGNGEAVFAGAKDFRPPSGPSGLGAVQSRLCYVVILSDRGTPDLRKLFTGPPVAEASGNPVWQWSAAPEEGHPKPYAFYITELPRSYVLISNTLEELQTLAAQLSSSGKDAPTFSDIRDWKLITQHDYWGYRRYRHAEVVDRSAAGMTVVTDNALALSFVVDFGAKAGTLRLYASDGSTAEKINAATAGVEAPWPTLKASAAGAWETTIPLAGDQEDAERMLGVLGLFGFGLYL